MPPKSKRAEKAAELQKAPVKTRMSERQKQLESIMAKVNREKRFGPHTVTRADQVIVPDRLSTGALAFDVAMSGGLPRNQWTEVIGNESSGKTTFVMKTLAHAQRLDPEYYCVWIASESFDPVQATMCGVDLTRVYLIEENVMEDAFDIALEFIEGRGCDMLVIDSYPALVTMQEDERDMDQPTMGGAKVLNLFMRKCTKASKRSLTDDDDRPFTGIIVNQWREKIGVIHGDPRTTPGGKGKNFWMYARLELKRDEWIVNKAKEKVGQAIKLICMKMKGARPQMIGVVDYYFVDHEDFAAGDYDDFKQIINLALYFDVIDRRGSGYVGPAGEFLKSQQALVDTLAGDLSWREQIERDVLQLAKRGKGPVETEPDEPTPLHAVDEDEEDVPSARPRRRRKTI